VASSGTRYRSRGTGRFVSPATVRSVLDRAVQAAVRDAQAVTGALREGAVTVAQWEAAMRSLVKDTHVYSAALAAGGWDRLDAAAYGRIGASVRQQYGFLARFAAQLAQGGALDGRVTARAALYAEHARVLFSEVWAAEMRVRDYREERNVLGAAEHCERCVTETRRGWVAIGALVPVGLRTCLARCRCRITYRR
jgi:hypothetical protein